MLEESKARCLHSGPVEILTPVEKLQVDEVAHPFAAGLRDRVQLLRHLMIGTRHRDRSRLGESEVREERDQVCGDPNSGSTHGHRTGV